MYLDSFHEMKVLVVGDIHGDLNLLMYPLKWYFEDADNRKVIFLGDYIDRWYGTCYIYVIIEYLIKHEPNIVFIRGNHETAPYISTYINNRPCITFMFNAYRELNLKALHIENSLIVGSTGEARTVIFSHAVIPNDMEIDGAIEFADTRNGPINSEQKQMLDFINSEQKQMLDFTTNLSGEARICRDSANVHGHDHLGTCYDPITTLARTHVCSVDFDGSIGMSAIFTRGTPISKTKMLVLSTDEVPTYIDFGEISLGSTRDYNSMSFKKIKEALLNMMINNVELYTHAFDNLLIENLFSYIDKMLLSQLQSHRKYFDSPMISAAIELSILKRRTIYPIICLNTIIYSARDIPPVLLIKFHDVPYEYYKHICPAFPEEHIPTHLLLKYVCHNQNKYLILDSA